ncbi:hypothetical protein EKO27_g9262 [Xylaria grammica]|uniref:Sphingolipid delta4-desaturase N-terminal domain-containing protein n=1 Tax=Xylaria grammica TaxID=363999 RepID=A0A439CUK7_9PEZI|nr:hypothetical protein EKO27_g9262 [Xylaria grammica]
MAPSAASTVTSTPKPIKERTIRVNGKRADAPAAQDDLPRDPLEVKYRDFFWTYTEEPHRTRRLEIIKAHPEVTKLCGPEPLTKYVVLLVVSIQVFSAYLLRDTAFFSPWFWLLAYVVGATANQNLFLAIHEISHNLAFRSPTANRLLAIFANLPIGVPYSASFRPYHLTHHKSLGVDGLDTDLPTALEAVFLDSILGKAFFCTFQIFFYALRPMAVYRVPFTWVSALNVAAQLAFDAAVFRALGPQSLLYFLLSSFLAGSLHPLAGHFIAEHYVYSTVTPAQADPRERHPRARDLLVLRPAQRPDVQRRPAQRAPRLPRRPLDPPAPAPRRRPRVLRRPPPPHLLDLRDLALHLRRHVGIRCRVKRKEGGRLVGQGQGAGASARKQDPAAEWKEDELQS